MNTQVYKISFIKKTPADLLECVARCPGPYEFIRSLNNQTMALIRTDEPGRKFLESQGYWPESDTENRSPETWKSNLLATYQNHVVGTETYPLPNVGGPDVAVFEILGPNKTPMVNAKSYASFSESNVNSSNRMNTGWVRGRWVSAEGFVYSSLNPEHYSITTPNRMFKVFTNERELTESDIAELVGNLAFHSVE